MAQNEFLQHVEARNLLDTAEIPRFEERLCVYRSEEKRLDRVERDDSFRRYHRRERCRDGRSGCRFHRGRNPCFHAAYHLLGIVLHVIEYFGDSFSVDDLIYLISVFIDTYMHGIGIAEKVMQVA